MRDFYKAYRREVAESKALPSHWIYGATATDTSGVANVRKDGYTLEHAMRDGYLRSAAYAISVNALAGHSSSVPWVLTENGKKVDDAENADEVYLINHPGRVSREFMISMLTMHKELAGNGCAQILIEGTYRELNVISPDLLEVRKSDAPENSFYRLKAHRLMSGKDTIPESEMVHAMHINPANAFWGLPPAAFMAPFINYDALSIRHNLSLVANHSVPPGFWTTDAAINDSEATALKKRLVESRKGEKVGEPVVASSGLKFVRTSFTPEEMDYGGGAKYAACMIAAAHGVSIFRLFPDASTYDNLEQSLRGEWTLGVIPRLKELGGAFSLKFLTLKDRLKGRRLEPDLSGVAVLQDDLTDEATAYEILVGSLVPPNKAAQALGLALDLGLDGDRAYRKDNLVPADLTEDEIAGRQL